MNHRVCFLKILINTKFDTYILHVVILKLQIVIYIFHWRILKLNMKMKLARIEKNLTQEQLAKLVNVSRQTIGLIEKEEYNPSLKLCISICKNLNKTLNDLFWEGEI